MSGQCSLSSHGVCQRLKGIPKRQLGWVRKFRSINWVTNECTKSAMKCSFSRRFACETHLEKISVYFIWIYFTTSSSPLQGISPHPQSLTSPTSMVVFLVDCPNAWPPSPWGNPWGPVPQAAHGANGQRLKELHSNGCIFSSLASLAQKKNDQLSREISGRWSVFSQKSWILFLAICIGMSEKTPRESEIHIWSFTSTETGLGLFKFYSIKGWLVLSHSVVELGKL